MLAWGCTPQHCRGKNFGRDMAISEIAIHQLGFEIRPTDGYCSATSSRAITWPQSRNLMLPDEAERDGRHFARHMWHRQTQLHDTMFMRRCCATGSIEAHDQCWHLQGTKTAHRFTLEREVASKECDLCA
eukprot:3934403-Rhodomonas_salina.2